MKKLLVFLILIFFALSAFADEYSWYYKEGKVVAGSEFTANAISGILYSNFTDLSALSLLQAETKEKYYWDSGSGKTILEHVPVTRAYRIIKNENEYSPYWIGIKSIGSFGVDRAEVSIGVINKPAYAWYLGSKENPFIEYDCNAKPFADASIELYDTTGQRKKTCSVVSVELISVNEEDSTVSLAIEYNETKAMKEIPLAKRVSEARYFFEYNPADKTIKTFRLEGLPIYVSFESSLRAWASFSFSFHFVPSRYQPELYIPNNKILENRYFVEEKNIKEFSINGLYEKLKNPPLKKGVLPEQKENLRISINVGSEVFDYLSKGKLTFDFYGIQANHFLLSLDSFGLFLLGKVPKGNYQLKLTSNDSRLKDWVSDVIEVNSNNTIIDLRDKINVKKETDKIYVLIPDEVVSAMDSSGIVPLVFDSTGKELDVPLTFSAEGLESGLNKWPVSFPEGEKVIITIPESSATKLWTWSSASGGKQVIVPKDTAKATAAKPDNKFILTVILGKENYKVFEKANFENIIYFVALEEEKDIIAISPDTTKKDRFKAELIKGKKYNLIIKKSALTRYYNYLKSQSVGLYGPNQAKPIDETVSEIDLSSELFGRTDSLLEKINAFAFLEAGQQKQENLQIKSVNGKTCTEISCEENKTSHIVYLDKEVSQILINLENYGTGRIFVSIGEKGKALIPNTTEPNSVLDYPAFNTENAAVFDFAEVKQGLKFSLDSYSGEVFGIVGWNGVPFHFFVCQDKTGDGKCDLKGYKTDGTTLFGANFIEPNFEAASIEVKQKTGEIIPKKTTEVGITIECDSEAVCSEEVIENAIDEILKQLPGNLADLRLDSIPNYPDATKVVIEIYEEEEEVNLTPVEVEATFGDAYICGLPPVSDSCSVIGDSTYVCDTFPAPTYSCLPAHDTTSTIELTPTDSSIVLTPGEEEKIKYKAKVITKQTERFGEQSVDCVIAMRNAEKYETEIIKYAGLYSIDADLIRGIIQQESSFDSDGIGSDERGRGSSYGLMQIHKTNLDKWTDIFGSDWKANESWKNPEKSIKAGTRYFNSSDFSDSVENWVNKLGCNEKELNKVLVNSGIAKVTWRTALKIARYNTAAKNVSCTEIKATSTRENYVPAVIAWQRIFKENYGKEAELGDDYCKPTKITTGTIKPLLPPVTEIAECNECSSIQECLACIDYKFVSGVFDSI